MNNNFEEIEKKLESSGIKPRFTNIHYDQEILNLENEFDISFPEDYKKFILKYGETTCENDIGYIAKKNNILSLENSYEMIVDFYGLESNNFNLCKLINTFLGRMPYSIIPIADCPGGNQICIGVKGEVLGKVYLWDHEKELDAYRMLSPNQIFPDIDKYWTNVYQIADSFVEFINSFTFVNFQTPKEKLNKIKICLVDEDFLKD